MTDENHSSSDSGRDEIRPSFVPRGCLKSGLLTTQEFDKPWNIEKVHDFILINIGFQLKTIVGENFDKWSDVKEIHLAISVNIAQR